MILDAMWEAASVLAVSVCLIVLSGMVVGLAEWIYRRKQ